ncbi:MAG TPA: UPF0175 family protein [Bryobacteraceae bacterium]|nr:hypothetical protein [Bryobacterales bacterium]HRJ17874.1 UPF0175 family protein [Bryobacteraceae bacterium]
MDVTVHIPDEIAARLSAGGGDLSRRALEAFALEECKCGRLSKAELRRLLGFATRYELDGFLRAHEIFEDDSIEDFEREQLTLRRLGF